MYQINTLYTLTLHNMSNIFNFKKISGEVGKELWKSGSTWESLVRHALWGWTGRCSLSQVKELLTLLFNFSTVTQMPNSNGPFQLIRSCLNLINTSRSLSYQSLTNRDECHCLSSSWLLAEIKGSEGFGRCDWKREETCLWGKKSAWVESPRVFLQQEEAPGHRSRCTQGAAAHFAFTHERESSSSFSPPRLQSYISELLSVIIVLSLALVLGYRDKENKKDAESNRLLFKYKHFFIAHTRNNSEYTQTTKRIWSRAEETWELGNL